MLMVNNDDDDYDNDNDDDESDNYEDDFKCCCIICDDNEVISSSFNHISMKANHLYPSCNHSCHFCIQCLQRIVSDKIKQSALSGMICPLPGCKLKFDHEFIKAITSRDQYIKYQQDILSLNNGTRSFLNILSDFRSNAFRVIKDCKRCPNCYYIIEKDGGCNHMQCRKCSFEFYWCCRQEWTPIHHEEKCFFNMYILPLLYLFLSPLLLTIVYFGMSFFVFLGKSIYLMVYLGSIFLSLFVIFLLRLKDAWEGAPSHEYSFSTKVFSINSLILCSILAYFTSDNIIASYIDSNENDSFRLFLLLTFFVWDTLDILNFIFKFRSNDQIVNIMVSFIITYATNGSILSHVSYIVPYIFKKNKNIRIADRNTIVTILNIIVILEVMSIIHTSKSIRTTLTALQILFSYLFIPFHYSQLSDVYNSMNLKRFENSWIFLVWCLYISTTFSTMMYKPMNTIGSFLSTILIPMMSIIRYIGLSLLPLLMSLLHFIGTILYYIIWCIVCILIVSKSDTFIIFGVGIVKEKRVDFVLLTERSCLIVTLVPFVYITITRYNANLYERIMNTIGIMILDLIFCQLGLIDNNTIYNSKSKSKKRSVITLVKDRVKSIYATIFYDNISLVSYSQYFWLPLLPSLLNNLKWIIPIIIIPILYVILLGLTMLGPLYYLTYIR